MNEKLLLKLKDVASRKARIDVPDFNAYDWSGGNFDDAYSYGCEDGEILFARELLKLIENEH